MALQLTEPSGRAPSRRSFLWGAASCLALAACADVDYQAPEAAVADRFDGAAPARGSAAESRDWWLSFRDAELNRLIEAGQARNLSVQQALAAIEEARATAAATGAADLPQVSGSAAATRGDTQGTGTRSTTSAGLGVSWLLDIFGANRMSRKAAAAQLDAAYLSADVARLVMESAIAQAYVTLRYNQESIALTKRSIESRKRSLELTKAQVEAGDAARLDQIQAEQLVAEGEAQLPAFETGFDQALAALATLTAERSATLRPRLQRGAPQPKPRFKASVGVPAQVIAARPDVRMAERNYAAAAYQVGVAKAAFYPSISLSGSITPTNIRHAGSISYWAVGPQIDLPIFTGGANTANLKGAEARALQAKLAWEAAVLTAIEEVESGLAAYNRDGRAIAAQSRLVSTSAEAVDLSRTNFSYGQGNFMSVLDAERSYLSAQEGLAAAERQRASDFITLAVAAAGGAR
ncbi:MAG: efflux transporter outer membrane subunit [Paenirhodobacter sp.]|uniref:efflux transporter outer membrane subunit n=1 Tax=Paenirhodobacter sp. TaxID=1965326 RepID=UPI003D0CEB81